MNPTLHAQILALKKYQTWRTGEGTRTMDEAGIVPSEITSALNAVIAIAENHLRDATKMIEPVKVPSDADLLAIHDEYFPTMVLGHENYLSFARALLARYCQPAASAEHVGEVFTMEPLDGSGQVKSHALLTKPLPAGTKLYTAPVAAQSSVPDLQALADTVVITNATGNPDLYRDAVTALVLGVRGLRGPDAPTPPADGWAQQDNIRTGYPYDDPRFERLCIEHEIWGTAQSALCAVFWRAAQQEADNVDALLQLIDEFRERLPSSFLTLVDAARAGKGE